MQNNHHCVANNLQQPCPVCSEVLFDSIHHLAILACGHAMHRNCHIKLLEMHMPVCMLCLQTKDDREATQAIVEQATAKLNAAPTPCDGDSSGDSEMCADSIMWGTDAGDSVASSHFCSMCRRRTECAQHAFGSRCVECTSFCS